MNLRLPIILFLAFVGTMLVAPLLTGERTAETETSVVAAAEPAALAPEPAPAAVPSEPLPGREAEAEERTLELRIGELGVPGSYQVEFTNRGARIANLKLTNYVDAADRTEEERADPEHWIPLLRTARVDGGRLASLEWRAMPSALPLLAPGESLQGALWNMEEVREGGRPVGVDFSYAPGTGVRFLKRVRFVPGSYELRVELGIENLSSSLTGPKQFELTPAVIVPRIAPDDSFAREPQALAGYGTAGDVEVDNYELGRKVPSEREGTLAQGKPLRFAGAHNKYFAAVLHPVAPGSGALLGSGWRILRDLDWLNEHGMPALPAQVDDRTEAWRFLVNDVVLSLDIPPQGATSTVEYELFAGPKSKSAMLAADEDYSEVMKVDLGFFSSISTLLLGVLGIFHAVTGNWGVAIILLTISVRLVLFPINRRSQTAMARYQAKMKRVQPKIDELKKKYESDPQRQRQEQAKLMQQEGAFPPLGGCLPMFLQIPVFWGLFSALRASFDLRQAPFALWIEDLSQPDALMELGWSVPILGSIETLNVLPPLMVVLWILQQRAMPKPADEQAARMQKMMMWMPIVFGVMLYNYAAGLSLYMITQSSLGIFEQRVIKKYWPVDDTEQPKKKEGFMARLAKAQEEQLKRLQAQQGDKARSQKGRGKTKKQRS